MKQRRLFAIPFFVFLMAFLISQTFFLGRIVRAQTDPITSENATPTTEIPITVVSTPTTYQRPLVVVHSYSASVEDITPGKEFVLTVKLANEGQIRATNVVATFVSGDFMPRETGGVIAVGDLDKNDRHKIAQPLTTIWELWGKTIATLEVVVNYNDEWGNAYSEKFVMTFPIAWGKVIGWATATPTVTTTPTPSLRPQLVIASYRTDVSTLQPGNRFALELVIQNVGNADAKRVTMILGGGSASAASSTPGAEGGGVLGGGADLSNFAPLGSSNVQSLGDLDAGQSISARQDLIVNVSTKPGAYPLKISFTYVDEDNRSFTDDQFITLLVYSVPLVEINFYRDPGPLMVGQPNQLPIQLVNLGRQSVILGNMKVSAEGADLSNNVILIGTLEAGGFFPLDATIIPYQPGTLDLIITVQYTDDFNQSAEITRTLTVEVVESPAMEPGMETPGGVVGPGGPGEYQPPAVETLWQKILRFLRGLIGLDSGRPTSQEPIESVPQPEEVEPRHSQPPLKGP